MGWDRVPVGQDCKMRIIVDFGFQLVLTVRSRRWRFGRSSLGTGVGSSIF